MTETRHGAALTVLQQLSYVLQVQMKDHTHIGCHLRRSQGMFRRYCLSHLMSVLMYASAVVAHTQDVDALEHGESCHVFNKAACTFHISHVLLIR